MRSPDLRGPAGLITAAAACAALTAPAGGQEPAPEPPKPLSASVEYNGHLVANRMLLELRCSVRPQPCDVHVTAKAYARAIGGKRLRGLDFDRAMEIRGNPRASLRWMTMRRSPKDDVRRYGSVRWNITMSAADRAGRVAQATTTATERAPRRRRQRPGAPSKPLSTRQKVERAVKNEAYDRYTLAVYELDCRRVTSRYWSCTLRGLTDRDAREGNIEGTCGRAGVDLRGSRWVAEIFGVYGCS